MDIVITTSDPDVFDEEDVDAIQAAVESLGYFVASVTVESREG